MGAVCSQLTEMGDFRVKEMKDFLTENCSIDAAGADAFMAASDWAVVPAGKSGDVFGEQDKPVDYLYIFGSKPEGICLYRAWNEPEKRYGLTDTDSGIAPKGFGLHVDEAGGASYQSGINDLVMCKPWEADPKYVFTVVVEKNEATEEMKVRRLPIAAWAGLPESFKQGFQKKMQEDIDAWIGRWRENGYGKLDEVKEHQNGYGQFSKGDAEMGAQFKANQAAWKLSHWGQYKFAWGTSDEVDGDGEVIEDPDTGVKQKREGWVWIVCHNPQAPEPLTAKNAIARKLKWEAPYIKASDSYGPRKLLNVPAPTEEFCKHKYCIRFDPADC